MELTTHQLAYIDKHLHLATGYGHEQILAWKLPTSRIVKVGDRAGSYDKQKQVHFTKIDGKKVPTLFVIYWLKYRVPALSLEIKGIDNPSTDSFIDTRAVPITHVDVAGYALDVRRLPNQAYARSELVTGIRFDKRRQTHNIYVRGTFVGSMDTLHEAVTIKALLATLDSRLFKALAEIFIPKQGRPWSIPSFSYDDGYYIIQNDRPMRGTEFFPMAKRYIKTYNLNKKRAFQMQYNEEAFIGIENVVAYNGATGEFRWKSGRKTKTLRNQANRPVIEYNGKMLSAAKVAYYLTNGVVPTKRVKCIDENPWNLRMSNLTTKRIRRKTFKANGETKKIEPTEEAKYLKRHLTYNGAMDQFFFGKDAKQVGDTILLHGESYPVSRVKEILLGA